MKGILGGDGGKLLLLLLESLNRTMLMKMQSKDKKRVELWQHGL